MVNPTNLWRKKVTRYWNESITVESDAHRDDRMTLRTDIV